MIGTPELPGFPVLHRPGSRPRGEGRLKHLGSDTAFTSHLSLITYRYSLLLSF